METFNQERNQMKKRVCVLPCRMVFKSHQKDTNKKWKKGWGNFNPKGNNFFLKKQKVCEC